MNEKMTFRFEQVPPPNKAPEHERAAELGLLPWLRGEVAERQFRCASCNGMVARGGVQVWIPDGVRRKDPAWSVEEFCRTNAYNGHFSAWCLKCARELSPGSVSSESKDADLERELNAYANFAFGLAAALLVATMFILVKQLS